MKRYLLTLAILCCFLVQNVFSQQQFNTQDPFAHTFSIVARDSTTGNIGVTVQSHWFSVGNTVSWVEAGVGTVATQSLVNNSFGSRALDLLKYYPQQAMD